MQRTRQIFTLLWLASMHWIAVHAISFGQERDTVEDPAWRYRLKQPAAGWEQAGFDDSSWGEGFDGFGNPTTPGSRVGTEWSAKEIWMRRSIELTEIPSQPGSVYSDNRRQRGGQWTDHL